MPDAPPATCVHRVHDRRCRHHNNGKVNRIGHIDDRGVTPVPEDLAGRRVHRVKGSAVMVFHEITNDTVSKFMRVAGGANNGNTEWIEERVKHTGTCRIT
jgi:hypothetical protein